ncbi:hypothetical protein Rhow_008757 [Rhodococcus wratislaviensis]|uniref:Uncharacterized protein n=1 Tax=Rhodococcus wratislaviensis TaxID=44752 RepID=A0A402CKY5_RHOWR|nr:hypothetical protein Rhow_008757 [Rhodococcus wratislaviensis]
MTGLDEQGRPVLAQPLAEMVAVARSGRRRRWMGVWRRRTGAP